MNHNQLAEEAINQFKKLPGVSKIILYGSVAYKKTGVDSDIDIAIILDDIMRGNCLDMEGFPIEYRFKIDRIIEPLQMEYIKFHIPLYYQSEFEKGILIYSERSPPEFLHEVGIIKFDFYETN